MTTPLPQTTSQPPQRFSSYFHQGGEIRIAHLHIQTIHSHEGK